MRARNRLVITFCTVALIASLGAAHRRLPEAGVIPDEATAVGVAEVVFQPVFGADHTRQFLPYHAQLKDGVWTVYGTLKEGSRGGTPELRINKKDGQVLEIWHSQ